MAPLCFVYVWTYYRDLFRDQFCFDRTLMIIQLLYVFWLKLLYFLSFSVESDSDHKENEYGKFITGVRTGIYANEF